MPDRARQHLSGWFGRWWFPTCALLLILGSDYKTRVRDPRSALGGGIDSAIILELAVYGAVGLYLVLVHARPPRIRRVYPHVYFACFFVGLMVLSVGYSAYPQYALVRAGQMCVLLGLVLVAGRVATRADMHRFAHCYIALIMLSTAYGVAVPSPPANAQQAGRFTWLAIHPTISGVLAGIATVLVVAYLTAGRKHQRPGPNWGVWGYLFALAVVGGANLAAHTRGAVSGTVVGIIVVLLNSRAGRDLVNLVIGLIVMSVGATLAFGGVVIAYFQRGEDAQQIASLNSRTSLWETAAQAIERKPLFGYGVTSARGIFYDATGLGGGHNAIVNVLVELGIVGIIVWAGLVVTLLAGTWRLPVMRFPEIRFDRAVILGIVTFLMVDGIFFEGPGSVTNVASIWFFVCIGWLSVVRRSIEPADDAPPIPETPPMIKTKRALLVV